MSIVERALAKAGASGARPPRSPESPRKPRTNAPRDELAVDAARHVDLTPELLRSAGLSVPPDMEARVAEELRLVKRPLLLNAERVDAPLPNGNLVMIGSALPGAGKTFLSINLALSVATELDWTVLLIDGDVSRPTLSRSLGLADAPGLVTLLEQEQGAVEDAAYSTNVPRLHVLPAGPSRPNMKELIGSQRMRSLIEDLASRSHRIVIIDSPPLLLTSEARTLASYAGQIVFVVEAGVTPRHSVLEAIETLDPSKAINLVLNKNRHQLGLGSYHQYAGYSLYGREADKQTEG